jgi:uncharacterized protein
MEDSAFVLDAVVHAFNYSESNFAIPTHAAAINQAAYGMIGSEPPPYSLPKEAFIRDWSVEEVADLVFLETETEYAIFHPTPINAYKDGFASVAKAIEARRRWPQRFQAYATVDPFQGEAALEELERQVELMDPLGVKLYPTTWRPNGSTPGWRMDDPEIAFPVIERAIALGLKSVAIHKAVPLGPQPIEPFMPGDVNGAAAAFPDMTFEIVHGGVAFAEETAQQVAAFPNIYVNMESLNILLALNPRRFAELWCQLLSVGGEAVIPRFFWATGGMAQHPRRGLEAFKQFQIPDDLLSTPAFNYVPQITDEHKELILGKNYAAALGLDLAQLAAGFADDEFEHKRRQLGSAQPQPWSTTTALSLAGS